MEDSSNPPREVEDVQMEVEGPETDGYGDWDSDTILLSEDEHRKFGIFGVSMFKGLRLSPVVYCKSFHETHSDVMCTSTSIPDEHERELADNQSDLMKKSGFSQNQGKLSISLSISSANQNRELLVERRIFMEKLLRERSVRSQVEEYSATAVQARVRGFILRSRREAEPEEEESVVELARAKSREGFLGRKRKRAEEGSSGLNFVKEEARIRKHLDELGRQTDKLINEMYYGKRKKRKSRFGVSKQKLHRSVLRIQTHLRKFLAVRVFKVKILYKEEKIQRWAVTRIQAHFRGWYGRNIASGKMTDTITKSTIVIQSYARRYLDLKFVQHVREQLRIATEENAAAIRLQNMLRKNIAKAKVMKQKMDQASLAVQRAYRGHTARKSFTKVKFEKNNAALKVQTIYRGQNARKLAKKRSSLRREEKAGAACKIQSLFRGKKGRKQATLKKETKAAIKIQGKRRQVKAKRHVAAIKQQKKEEEAASKLQANIKLEEKRKEAEQTSAATRIQTRHRIRMAEKEKKERISARENKAATTVQKRHRGILARKNFKKKKRAKAATQIQSSMRSKAASSSAEQARTEINKKLVQEAEEGIDASISTQRVRRASRKSL